MDEHQEKRAEAQSVAYAEEYGRVFAEVRRRSYAVLRVSTVGVVLTAVMFWFGSLMRGESTVRLFWTAIVVLLLALGVWVVRPSHPRLGASLFVFVGLTVAGLVLYAVGPVSTVGALMATVVAVAALFLDRRVSYGIWGLCAALLFGNALLSWLGGWALVGPDEGAHVTLYAYVRIATVTTALTGVVLFLARAAIATTESSLIRLRELRAREQEERDLRHRAERAAARSQRLEAVGRLAGGVAHDVNNVLTVFLSGLDELRSGAAGQSDKAVLDTMERAARSMGQTTQLLTTFSRRQPTAPTRVAPGAALEQFEGVVRRLLPSSVIVRRECSSGRQLHVDPALLEQALLNLVINARDAMPDGGELWLSARDHEDGAETTVALEVRDTGHGMDAATLEHALEPFFTTKPEGKGTGLGLSMVHGFVTEAGGHLELESAPGRGTCVRLVLPAAPGDPA